ncbi:hypothetical protein D3C72_85670 [compost metagenome]
MQSPSFILREECPQGLCTCARDDLLSQPDGDLRILRLTKMEEKKLIARIEAISSYADLKHMEQRMQAQLGIALQITPGLNEVRTVRGLNIVLEEQAGLCRKTRQTIPAAIRKCLERNPQITYAILDADGLFAE